MAHAISLPDGVGPRFDALLPALQALLDGEPDRTANCANAVAVLYEAFSWHWVGFYRVDTVRDCLVLGPFQGPVACTRLYRGRGVCAAAWETGTTVVVPDVEAFPGHVACRAKWCFPSWSRGRWWPCWMWMPQRWMLSVRNM